MLPAPADPADAALFAASSDAVLLVDGGGRCVDANPAACRLLGYARDELLGLRAADLVAADPGRPEGARGRDRAAGRRRGGGGAGWGGGPATSTTRC